MKWAVGWMLAPAMTAFYNQHHMASHPIPAPTVLEDTPLTRDEWWELLWSLEGSMEGWFPEEGGASGVLLKEREAWGE